MRIILCMVPEIWTVMDRIFCYFRLFFFPFTQTTWKIKPLKKMKKTPRDIIILHMCTINDNHIMHGSWDMKCDGYRFLSCWAIFCSFALLTTQKTKILKKGKKPWKYYHFTHDHMIICCAVPEIQCMRNETFIFYFELFSVCPSSLVFFIFNGHLRKSEITILFPIRIFLLLYNYIG